MREEKQQMKLRNCYDKDGHLLDKDTQLDEYPPLQEMLDMFRSLHEVNITVSLEDVG